MLLLEIAVMLAQTLIAGNQLRGAESAWVHGHVDFGSIAAASCLERSIPAPGATPGMPVAPGWPATMPGGLYGLMYTGADSVVVRMCNAGSAPVSFSGSVTARIIAR